MNIPSAYPYRYTGSPYYQPSYMSYPYPAGQPTMPPASAQTSPPPGMGGAGQMGGTGQTGGIDVPGVLPMEESYIENILRLNRGKLATVYATFENNQEWNARTFTGLIEAAGRDHLILSDPQTGRRVLLPMVYFDYATFDEELEYQYPFDGGPLASYPPR
ncbi:hypothetical protein QY97_00873 [Bacillus thermotolerans]|uniref:Spore coat protein GerQ n=2 Tax=Bacillus thermotolerans TaxID=1221996 RepID=A0A0F5HSX0_BACTR|nr:hypothetical protein QY97_00873 [Bacillus thermotolerans]KKB41056.1 hypothetical protein QY95_01119 [Bacillus thermotolerans]KKB44878.1 hypothetical protein QY96_00002 [Bacillus thermotolerans]